MDRGGSLQIGREGWRVVMCKFVTPPPPSIRCQSKGSYLSFYSFHMVVGLHIIYGYIAKMPRTEYSRLGTRQWVST
jgi:hypothetical protein